MSDDADNLQTVVVLPMRYLGGAERQNTWTKAAIRLVRGKAQAESPGSERLCESLQGVLPDTVSKEVRRENGEPQKGMCPRCVPSQHSMAALP